MTISQEPSGHEETEKDLEAREKDFLERTAKERAEGKSWRLRQLRKMSSGPNTWAAPRKN
jgi:hypothetical protein